MTLPTTVCWMWVLCWIHSVKTASSKCGFFLSSINGPRSTLIMMFQEQHWVAKLWHHNSTIGQLQWWSWNNVNNGLLKFFVFFEGDMEQHKTSHSYSVSNEQAHGINLFKSWHSKADSFILSLPQGPSLERVNSPRGTTHSALSCSAVRSMNVSRGQEISSIVRL